MQREDTGTVAVRLEQAEEIQGQEMENRSTYACTHILPAETCSTPEARTKSTRWTTEHRCCGGGLAREEQQWLQGTAACRAHAWMAMLLSFQSGALDVNATNWTTSRES